MNGRSILVYFLLIVSPVRANLENLCAECSCGKNNRIFCSKIPSLGALTGIKNEFAMEDVTLDLTRVSEEDFIYYWPVRDVLDEGFGSNVVYPPFYHFSK